jgi:hypothetical protein
MKFDEQGRIVWTPRELFAVAVQNSARLIGGFLMAGHTPAVFPTHAQYCDFFEAISERTGIYPRNLYLRGSCQIGFSIAPRVEKVWAAISDKSDLDLVIVDSEYFRRIEEEVLRWESRNPEATLEDIHAEHFTRRKEDRLYNCCWDKVFPPPVGVHHKDTMRIVAAMQHCGCWRKLSAFIYPDWLSARRRYERDVRLLVQGVQNGTLEEPGDTPTISKKAPATGTITAPVPASPKKPPKPPEHEFGAGILDE